MAAVLAHDSPSIRPSTLRSYTEHVERHLIPHLGRVRLVELPTPRRPQAQVWTEHRVQTWQPTGERLAVAVWTTEQLAAFLESIAEDRLYPIGG